MHGPELATICTTARPGEQSIKMLWQDTMPNPSLHFRCVSIILARTRSIYLFVFPFCELWFSIRFVRASFAVFRCIDDKSRRTNHIFYLFRRPPQEHKLLKDYELGQPSHCQRSRLAIFRSIQCVWTRFLNTMLIMHKSTNRKPGRFFFVVREIWPI